MSEQVEVQAPAPWRRRMLITGLVLLAVVVLLVIPRLTEKREPNWEGLEACKAAVEDDRDVRISDDRTYLSNEFLDGSEDISFRFRADAQEWYSVLCKVERDGDGWTVIDHTVRPT